MRQPATETRPVRVGIDRTTFDVPMTRQAARRLGERLMPPDLKRVGFETVVSASDPEMHGGSWWRIEFCKSFATR